MNPLPETSAQIRSRRHAQAALACLAAAARTFFTAAVDLQTAGNAAWLQALLSPVAALPAFGAFLLLFGRKVPTALRRMACAVLSVLFIAELSEWAYASGECAAFTALTDLPLAALILPALTVAAFVASKGGNAGGGLGVIASLILPLLFLAATVSQIRRLHPLNLLPVLGGGAGAIARGAFLCADGCLLLPSGLWVLWGDAEEIPAQEERRLILRALPLCAGVAAALLLVYGMLSPNETDAPHTSTHALEQLITGSGGGPGIQFFLMLFWYDLLCVACVFSCSAAARSLCGAFSCLPLRASSWLSAAAAACLLPLRLQMGSVRERHLSARVLLITVLFALLASGAYWKERRDRDG